MNRDSNPGITKLPVGIHGFDQVAAGGLPFNRTTLVTGTAGSGKTVFASQFLAEGILQFEEPGVFVTFEETPPDLRRNMIGFGWDIPKWEADNMWTFVDASPSPGEETIFVGHYDLGALLARIRYATEKIGAKRVVMDSLGAIFSQFSTSGQVRSELLRIATVLKEQGVTVVLTAERREEYGDISRYGVEEFATDNVIILRNVLEGEKRRRTLEILKFRGTHHQKGEYPFTIISGEGMVLIPLSSLELKQHSANVRVTSGIPDLDVMSGGGFFRDSIILVSGATGTGKTLTATHFVAGGNKVDDRCLYVGFEESRDQLFRNANGWGMDMRAMESAGQLRVVCEYPEVKGLEDHLIHLRYEIEEFQPNRVVIDSLSALERISTRKGFREFIISLTSFIKHQEITGLFTSTTPSLMGGNGSSVTEAHISTLTDSIILLRYVEMFGSMRRGITMLKMRGSMHDKNIRQFYINHEGMHIGEPFRNVTGILHGSPIYTSRDDNDPVEGLFSH